MMRIIAVLLCFVVLSSCSVDSSEQPVYSFESVPIESVVVPEAFVLGQTFSIKINYKKPTNCHQFNNLLFDTEGNQRTIVVINSVLETDGCAVLVEEIEEISFNLSITSRDTHVFRFWQGKDENDNDMYYIVEIPVFN